MFEFFLGPGASPVDKVFLVCALVGGILFVVRVILLAVGGDGDHGGDVSEVDVHDVHVGADADASFTLFSVHGLTAFFMMFGLVGLALSRETGAGAALSTLGGGVAGVASAFLMAWIFSLFVKMQHSGTLNIQNAIGNQGTVYLTIPEGETGRVRVTVQGRLKVFDAVSEDKTTIPTDASIEVVEVVSGNILVVKKL